jgi:hypothetical protein
MIFLVGLGHVDNVCPVLFVFGFKIAQKVIKTFVAFRQVLNRRIQRLAFFLLVALDEALNFFDFLNGFGPACVAAAQRFLAIVKEEHAAFLILVLRRVQYHMRPSPF